MLYRCTNSSQIWQALYVPDTIPDGNVVNCLCMKLSNLNLSIHMLTNNFENTSYARNICMDKPFAFSTSAYVKISTRNTCVQQPLATKSMQLYFRNYMKYLYRLLS